MNVKKPLPILLTLVLSTLLPIIGQTNSGKSPAVVVLGDSISAGYGIQIEQGWVNLFNQKLQRQELAWRTVNASVSGETTSGGLARLPRVLADHQPGIVIVELGGNDGLRGYPIKRMRDNLGAMVKLIQDAGAKPVLMRMRIPPNYGPRYTRDFEAAYEEIGAEFNVPVVPFFLQDVALSDGMMQQDGIHPTATAQPVMAEFVWSHLAPLLRGHTNM